MTATSSWRCTSTRELIRCRRSDLRRLAGDITRRLSDATAEREKSAASTVTRPGPRRATCMADPHALRNLGTSSLAPPRHGRRWLLGDDRGLRPDQPVASAALQAHARAGRDVCERAPSPPARRLRRDHRGGRGARAAVTGRADGAAAADGRARSPAAGTTGATTTSCPEPVSFTPRPPWRRRRSRPHRLQCRVTSRAEGGAYFTR